MLKSTISVIATAAVAVAFTASAQQRAFVPYTPSVKGDKAVTDGITAITLNGRSLAIATSSRHHFTDQALPANRKWTTHTLEAAYSGDASALTLSIDFDQNGKFDTSDNELMFENPTNSRCDFTLPATTKPGVYRARLKAGNHCEVEFLVNVADINGEFDYDVANGLALNSELTSQNSRTTPGEALHVALSPTLPGFALENEVIVRHGHGLNGPQYITGNRQWNEYSAGHVTELVIPADSVDGDVMVTARFLETDTSEWTKIWGDEFDGDTIDMRRWNFHPRWSSTWNKRIAVGDEIPYVNKIENGHYCAYAIPTPEEFRATESQEIITGALYSENKFYLTGGKIEARIRTRAHRGNFPAFWMMPQDQSAGWPNCGEIDIWEQIDASFDTYHTVHTAWTKQTLGSAGYRSPQSSASMYADPEAWHVFALEWSRDEYLKWWMDGREVFVYENQHYSNGPYTEDMTWPFAKAFHVIINQSVGDGSWAANGDPEFEYLTEFDYVRAYQRKDALSFRTQITGNGDDYGMSEIPAVGCTEPDAVPVFYNLQGVKVDAEHMAPGIYIELRGSATRKIIVR